jgi:general secretion pathway protein M
MKVKESIVRLKERIDRLEERERKLLAIFLGILGVMVVVLVPTWVAMSVGAQAEENDRVREIIQSIVDERVTLGRRRADLELVERRYQRKAPELASFLAQTAEKEGVEIPETQDRSTVPHGKAFKERVTKISLRKVGMLKLSNFLGKVENSGYAVSISRLKIRTHSNTPDLYDAEIEVSAFDREGKANTKKGKDVSENKATKPADEADNEAEE